MNIFEIFSKDYPHKKAIRLFNEGVKENEQENYPKALNKFLQALQFSEKANTNQAKKNELIVPILFLIAFVRGKLNQFELAEQAITRAILLSPSDARLLCRLGDLKLDQGHFEEAVPIFDQAIKLNPLNTDSHFSRSLCMMELKRFKEAISDIEIVLKTHPNHLDALFHLAFIYEELKEYNTAITFYDKVIGLNNKDNKAFVNRGNCKIELGQNTEACKDFYIALELGDQLVQENIDEFCKGLLERH